MPNNTIKCEILDDDQKMGKRSAEIIFLDLKEKVKNENKFVLGCPGGRTPRSTYRELARLIKEHNQSLQNVVIAMMDDYLIKNSKANFENVDITSHFSCRKFAYDEIRDVLNSDLLAENQMPVTNVWVPEADSAKDYELKLRQSGVDIFLLASGASDGHVAFNGFGSNRNDRTRVTPLSLETRTDNLKTFPDFASLDEVPKYGITVGPATIVDVSKKAIMLLSGAHKSHAFKRISGATKYESDWPATIIAECSNALIIADKFAATAN